jgi:ABC-type polysaccharide/polyol phosphate transport system ATPase subunit
MNLYTVSKPSDKNNGNEPVVKLGGVSVRYRMAQERIPSLKEFFIRKIKGHIKYQSFWALNEVHLEIMQGEVFGIIGPNGAGKSTLLKVIARVLRPTKGSVYVRGLVSPLLELGAGFDNELTGRENIYLNGAILGFSKANIDNRVDRIIDFAGLRNFIDAPLRTYSTGMIARLGFAVATDVRPDILIVDEILSVGDGEFQTRSFERIQNFKAEGTTILLVSHSLGRVEEMCSRVMWLDHGKIVSLGSAKSVVEEYKVKIRDVEAERLAQGGDIDSMSRWGTSKIKITDVRIKDENGTEQQIYKTGQPLILEMDYDAREPVKSPVFGMSIHRHDGVHITGPNTGFSGQDLGVLNGKGTVIYIIPNLPLLEGLYHFSVAATNQQDTEMYDYHDRAYPFRVINIDGVIKERYGIITLCGEWKHRSL